MPAKGSSNYNRGAVGKSTQNKGGLTQAQKAEVLKAAQREVGKNVETQYSQAVVTLTQGDTGGSTLGWRLRGLSELATGSNPAQCMGFNLCGLSQVGNAVQPGYRQGQRINALYITAAVSITVANGTSDCDYHWAVVKRKSDQQGQNAFPVPQLIDLKDVGLFKSISDGPFAAASITALEAVPPLAGVTQSDDGIPDRFYPSQMRRNIDQWQFVNKGSGKASFRSQNQVDLDDNVIVNSVHEKLYIPLAQEWDFVNRGGSDIKGGNLFFIMWREGPPTIRSIATGTSSVTTGPASSKIAPIFEQIKVTFELAFKDG